MRDQGTVSSITKSISFPTDAALLQGELAGEEWIQSPDAGASPEAFPRGSVGTMAQWYDRRTEGDAQSLLANSFRQMKMAGAPVPERPQVTTQRIPALRRAAGVKSVFMENFWFHSTACLDSLIRPPTK